MIWLIALCLILICPFLILMSSCRLGGPIQLSLLHLLPPWVLLWLHLFKNLAIARVIQLSSLIHHHFAKLSLLLYIRLLKVLYNSTGPGLQYRTVWQCFSQICRLLQRSLSLLCHYLEHHPLLAINVGLLLLSWNTILQVFFHCGFNCCCQKLKLSVQSGNWTPSYTWI